MNLGKYIFGIREEYFSHLEKRDRNSQFVLYNSLTLMYFILIGLSFFAGVIYGLMIFHSWLLAIFSGIIIAVIYFFILQLIFFLSLITNNKTIYDHFTQMDRIFKNFDKSNIESQSDEELIKSVDIYISELRFNADNQSTREFHSSFWYTSTIKVIVVLLFSCVVANGIEMFIFRSNVNHSLAAMKDSLQTIHPIDANTTMSDSTGSTVSTIKNWTLSMLIEKESQPFVFIDSYSILLNYDVLLLSLGNWKILFDLFFGLVFLIPFVLVRKVRAYSEGTFLKEAGIVDIKTALLFYLLSQRKVRQIHSELKVVPYHFEKKNKHAVEIENI